MPQLQPSKFKTPAQPTSAQHESRLAKQVEEIGRLPDCSALLHSYGRQVAFLLAPARASARRQRYRSSLAKYRSWWRR